MVINLGTGSRTLRTLQNLELQKKKLRRSKKKTKLENELEHLEQFKVLELNRVRIFEQYGVRFVFYCYR